MALASYRASGIVRLVRHSQQRPAGEVDSSRRFRRLVFARLEVFSFSISGRLLLKLRFPFLLEGGARLNGRVGY